MSDQKKVNLPVFEAAPIQECTQRFTDITLENGVKIRLSNIVREVHRIVGEWDDKGQPMYRVNATVGMTVDAPAALQRPVEPEPFVPSFERGGRPDDTHLRRIPGRVDLPRPASVDSLKAAIETYSPHKIHMGFWAWLDYAEEQGFCPPVDRIRVTPPPDRPDEVFGLVHRKDLSPGNPMEPHDQAEWIQLVSVYSDPHAFWLEVDERRVN